MDRPTDDLSPMSVLGFTAVDEELYRVLLRHSPVDLDRLSALAGQPHDDVRSRVARFAAAGLVELHGGSALALPPDRALGRLITDEGDRLRSVQEQLDALRRMLPGLAEEHLVSGPRGRPVGVETVAYDDVVDVIRSLTARSTGDLLWIRSDQWRIPESRPVDAWVRELLRAGRRSRVIYPARVLEEAPDMVRGRAELGEHVRVLAAVPGRLAVMGGVALIPTLWESPEEQLLVVRQPSLVQALSMLFEELWGRALAVPGIAVSDDADHASDRRLLLDLLARGAKDEQIARTLGLSLRTVRRRVSFLLEDLGAASRFQAGVEAVRRGWL